VTIPDEVGVAGTTGSMTCSDCLETGGPDPLFLQEYKNGSRASVVQIELGDPIQVPGAFDEGGNFLHPQFGPLSINVDLSSQGGVQVSDYHIKGDSPAKNAGSDLTGDYSELETDFDGDPRPNGPAVDIGADER
jgi:hypothetical protein